MPQSPGISEPIDSECAALTLIASAIKSPLQQDTLVVLLDDERYVLSIITITGTTPPDAMFDIIEIIIEAGRAAETFDGLIVASIRPDGGIEPADVDRWFEANELVDPHGVELVEWFVVGHTIECPRDLIGEPPRWRSG